MEKSRSKEMLETDSKPAGKMVMQMEDDFNNDMQQQPQVEEEVAVVNKKAPKNEAVRSAAPSKKKD